MQKHLFSFPTRRFLSKSIPHDLYDPPFSHSPKLQKTQNKFKQDPPNLPLKSDLPFNFMYSYSETHPSIKPISFRESPKFSPFGPGRLDRKWTGTSAPVQHQVDRNRFEEDRNRVLGAPLEDQEVAELVERYRHSDCSRQINLGIVVQFLLFYICFSLYTIGIWEQMHIVVTNKSAAMLNVCLCGAFVFAFVYQETKGTNTPHWYAFNIAADLCYRRL